MPVSQISRPLVGLCASHGPIPLEHVAVRADVTGAHARVTCTQRYRNQERQPIEAVYVFPLDEGAAVCGFAAVVGGVRYEGVVRPREEAFAAYDDAMSEGHGAFLLDEERPDVFTASIGNLAPGADVEIELTYVTELPYEGDAIRFTLPTTVSPRYAPAQDTVGIGQSQAETLNPPRAIDPGYGLSFSARVTMPGRLRRIESPSHPISVDLDGGTATVTLGQENVALDRDLVLLVTPSESRAPQVVLERGANGRIAAAIGFCPAFDMPRVPADVVFVVDRSGSMEGSSIEQARNAMQLCLRSLDAGCRFNIVGFGSKYESLFRECRPYDEKSLAEASAYVSSLEATLGGTELLPALEFVLGAIPPERVVQLVVMTDGQVTNTDAAIDAVRRRQDRVRVFTFGIGRGASHHLVNGLARAGGGTADYVFPGERLEPKVVRLFKRALSPALIDVRIDWGGQRVTTIPERLAPVFASEPFRAYGLMDECRDGTVTLHARAASGPLSWSVELLAGEIVEGKTVGALAARARIREIEEGGDWLPDRGSRQRGRKTELVSSEIVRLATEYGLSSRETSWVVVEHREVPLTGEVELRKVPVAITSGWGGRDESAFPQASASLGGVQAWRLLGAPPASSPLRQASAGFGEALLSQFKRRPAVAREPVAELRDMLSSMRALDRLVALQRADGSWDLDKDLARILGLSLSRLELALAGAVGDTAEARRAWATALAIRFLTIHASSNRGEWELLADKAARWLAGVKAAPAGGTWMTLAENVQFAGDSNA